MTDSKSAYAGGDFEYDVFLSYAWVNNNPKGIVGNWVSGFQERLEATLNARLGRSDSSKFFFDIKTLGKSTEFGPQIEDALRKSATVVAVISKGYIESPNCREELRFFDDKVVPEAISKSGRLYLVWYDCHDEKGEWPDQYREEFSRRVQGLIGYEFFALVDSVASGKPCRPKKSKYQTSLLQLTTDLAKHLTGRRKQAGFVAKPRGESASSDSNGIAAAHVVDSGPTVLIAQSFPDRTIRKRRQKLADWCRNAGCNVLGEHEYAAAPAELGAEFKADLQQAHLVVQLFTDNWFRCDQKDFPDGLEAWQQQQAENVGIEVIQCRDRALRRPNDKERSEFDDDERRHFDLIFGPEIMTAEPSELHPHVVERAQVAFELGRLTPSAEGDRSLLIKVSEDDFREHEATLLELGRQVVCTFAHNGRSVVERYRRRKFDAVVVVLGQACTQEWCDERVNELIESRQSFRDTGPVHAWFNTGTWQGAPPLMAPGFLIIRGRTDLRVLFNAINKEGAK